MNAGWLYGEVGLPSRAGGLLIGEAAPLARDLGLPTAAITAWGAGYLWLAGRWSEGRKALDDWAREGGVRSGRGRGLKIVQDLYDVTTQPVALRFGGVEPIDVDD